MKRWKITVRANLMDTKADAFEGKLKTSRRETLTRFFQIEVFQSLLWDRNLLFSSRLETFGISGSMTSRTSKNNFLLHLLETSWGLSCHLSLSMLSYNCTSHYLFINSQSASTLHSRDCWVVSKVNTLCGQMTRSSRDGVLRELNPKTLYSPSAYSTGAEEYSAMLEPVFSKCIGFLCA